jgi:hypothetical protein
MTYKIYSCLYLEDIIDDSYFKTGQDLLDYLKIGKKYPVSKVFMLFDAILPEHVIGIDVIAEFTISQNKLEYLINDCGGYSEDLPLSNAFLIDTDQYGIKILERKI